MDVGLPLGLRERVRELAGHLHVLMVEEDPAPSHGQVTLVGGGPGRTSLLTLEACAALRRADVVFYERLALTDDLAELAAGAELVDMGQLPYAHPMAQDVIGAALVARARAGESVVRLTGGDPFVFGRGRGDAGLHRGRRTGADRARVSSALAVPGGRGMVTRRAVSRSCTMISDTSRPEATAGGAGPNGRDHRGADGDRHPAPERARAEPGGLSPLHPPRSSNAASRLSSVA